MSHLVRQKNNETVVMSVLVERRSGRNLSQRDFACRNFVQKYSTVGLFPLRGVSCLLYFLCTQVSNPGTRIMLKSPGIIRYHP
jgi:hypothetical protein